MKRFFIFSASLFFIGAAGNFSFAQLTRNPSQIREETRRRNEAVNNPDNNPFNHTNPTSGTGRFMRNGRIPGSAIRGYVLAAQARTEVNVVEAGDGDKLLVDDGTNRVVVRILGIDAPERGQPFYEESKRNLSEALTGKRVVLVYSLNNLKDEAGYFPARIFIGGKDIGLNALENGFAWRNDDDKFFFEKKDDAKNKEAVARAQGAKVGIWRAGAKPQTPWKYRAQKSKEMKRAKEKRNKNKNTEPTE